METQKNVDFDKKIDEALDKMAPGAKPKVEPAEPKVEPAEPKVEPKVEPAEPKVEPKVDPKVESKVEPADLKVEPKVEPKVEVLDFDYKSFNERFGTEFTEENIKSSLSRLTEYDSLKEKFTKGETDLAELQAKYGELKDLFEPRKHFANEEEYRRQLILQKHGQDINPSMLNKIVASDFSQMSDLDVLVMGKRVGNPNLQGGDPDIKEMIYRQLGVEDDFSEWSAATKNIISEAANNVRKELTKLKDVDVPEKVDFEKQRTDATTQIAAKKEELTGQWSEIATELVKGFNEFTLKNEGEAYFTYQVDDGFKKEATDFVVGYLVDNAMEPTKENLREAQSYVEDLFWRKHGNDIVRAYGEDVKAKITGENQKDLDNPMPPNETDAPPDVDDKQKDLIEYARGGLGKSRKAGDDLFG